jgi:transposase-like protein
MPQTRKNHPPSLKAKVAVEAIKAHKTAAQIAQMFGVHPTQVGSWKSRHWPVCQTCSAMVESRSGSRQTRKKKNCTKRSGN